MPPTPKRLIIVDAHAHAFRAYWALPAMYAPDGRPNQVLYGFAGLLHRLLHEDRPDYIAVAFDDASETRRTFRTTLYPDYKAHRDPRPDALNAQLPLLRDLTRAFGLRVFEDPHYEADDLIGSLVQLAETHALRTTILSGDKDLLQLVSPHTTLWDGARGRTYHPEAVREKFGVLPTQMADYLALCGDASDNIPGVNGIGPKRARRLLQQHHDLATLLHIAQNQPTRLPPREARLLQTGHDQALLSQQLTRLALDAPLDLGPQGIEALRLPTHPQAPPDFWQHLGLQRFAPRAPRTASSQRIPIDTRAALQRLVDTLPPQAPFALVSLPSPRPTLLLCQPDHPTHQIRLSLTPPPAHQGDLFAPPPAPDTLPISPPDLHHAIKALAAKAQLVYIDDRATLLHLAPQPHQGPPPPYVTEALQALEH